MLPLLYKAMTRPLAPVAMMYLAQRRKRGKEHPIRFHERRGIPSATRPDGPLVWIHAASVGEATSVLGLIEHLLATRPSLEILITTGTVTSAILRKPFQLALGGKSTSRSCQRGFSRQQLNPQCRTVKL